MPYTTSLDWGAVREHKWSWTVGSFRLILNFFNQQLSPEFATSRTETRPLRSTTRSTPTRRRRTSKTLRQLQIDDSKEKRCCYSSSCSRSTDLINKDNLRLFKWSLEDEKNRFPSSCWSVHKSYQTQKWFRYEISYQPWPTISILGPIHVIQKSYRRPSFLYTPSLNNTWEHESLRV